MNKNLKNNSLDQFSKPIKQEKSILTTVFWLNYRDSKKGRLFLPVYDERFPFKFLVKYAYFSKFLEKNNISGNHYHKIKEEILIPIEGEFEICLEDINTRKKEIITVNSEEKKGFYIKTEIAHSIKSKKNIGILLVLASKHSTLEDEIEYLVFN